MQEADFVKDYYDYLRKKGRKPVIVFGSFSVECVSETLHIYDKPYHIEGAKYNSINDNGGFNSFISDLDFKFDHNSWQPLAKEFMRHSDYIFMFLDTLHFDVPFGDVENIWRAPLTFYEIRHIIENKYLYKTIFILKDEIINLNNFQIEYVMSITRNKLVLCD